MMRLSIEWDERFIEKIILDVAVDEWHINGICNTETSLVACVGTI